MNFLLVPGIWFLSAGACWAVCRYREIQASMVQCLIIGGLPIALGAVPVPFPYLLKVALGYGLTVYVTMKYLGVALYPDGFLIPLVTHGVGGAVLFVLGRTLIG